VQEDEAGKRGRGTKKKSRTHTLKKSVRRLFSRAGGKGGTREESTGTDPKGAPQRKGGGRIKAVYPVKPTRLRRKLTGREKRQRKKKKKRRGKQKIRSKGNSSHAGGERRK